MRQVRSLNWQTVFSLFCLCMNDKIISIEISWTKHEDNIGHVVFALDYKDGKKIHKIP